LYNLDVGTDVLDEGMSAHLEHLYQAVKIVYVDEMQCRWLNLVVGSEGRLILNVFIVPHVLLIDSFWS